MHGTVKNYYAWKRLHTQLDSTVKDVNTFLLGKGPERRGRHTHKKECFRQNREQGGKPQNGKKLVQLRSSKARVARAK